MKQGKSFPEIFLTMTLVSVSTMLLISNVNSSFAQTEDEEASTSEETNVVRDSAIVLLEGKSLAGNDFIHVYDSTPYIIMNGHVAAKLPCDDNSESPVEILIGSAPNLTAANLDFVSELSTPGVACLYHVDLESVPADNASSIITDIAIQNPSGDEISFGQTTSVVIGVNEIAKGSHEDAHAEGDAGEHPEEDSGAHAEGDAGEHPEEEEPADDSGT